MFKSDSNKPPGSGVPSHFSGSKAASANEGLLLISGLQTQMRLIIIATVTKTLVFTRASGPQQPLCSLTQKLSLLLCLTVSNSS